MAELTAEQKAAIDNYGDEIVTMKDFVSICRRRPGFLLGPIGAAGFINMCREIFQNSIDQIMDPASPANWFRFFYDERTLEVEVEDNGRGFPINDMIRILTKEYTSKNYTKVSGQYSSGMNGVGSKVVKALSTVFIVETYLYTGEAARLECKNGYPITKEPKLIKNTAKKQGSMVKFIPDESVLGECHVDWKELYVLIKRIMSLTPIGSKMTFEAIDLNGNKFHEDVVNKDGIITDLIMKSKSPIIKPITVAADDGSHKLEAAFCWDAGENGPLDQEEVTSFCNFCPTKGETHVNGTIDGICRWFSKYMNDIYLANQKAKDKLKITASDVKTGLNIMISAAHIEPEFTGQAKEILSNQDMVPFCRETVMRGLDQWSKSNPQDLQKVSRFIKEIAELRIKEEAGRAKIVQKYQANVITGLPSKYVRPLGRTNIELIIVEGDSAKGNVVEGRDPMTQGILPIKGKISNAFRNSKSEFFSNEEIQSIVKIVFGREWKPGEKFTLEDCKVSKVIFMADADVDGGHICKLLLSIFVVYFPFMIEAGMIYKAVPPLYSVKQGKKEKFFTEQIDIIKYVQKIFMENHKMTFLDKKPLESRDLTLFFMRNADYVYYTERMANTFALNPLLLEKILFNWIDSGDKINYEKLKKDINSTYRFMDVYKMKDGTIEVKGVIDKSNVAIINQRFIKECDKLIEIIKSNDKFYYIVDGNKLSIYQIATLYNKSTPNAISRYKGLGEMQTEQLVESVLRADKGNRTLIRYTMQDIKETQEIMRTYESDPKKILSLIGTVTRDDLID